MTRLIKQKTPHDCVLASIAMLANKPYTRLWTPAMRKSVEGDPPGATKDMQRNLLIRAGFDKTNIQWVYLEDIVCKDWIPEVLKWRKALVVMPSLNMDRSTHMVYWDGEEIFDPSTKQVYKFPSQLQLAHGAWIAK